MTHQPFNKNIKLYSDNYYLGLPIQVDKGPFVFEYLDRLYKTIMQAVKDNRETFSFRFDLRFPSSYYLNGFSNENEMWDRFITSFKAKIKHNRQIASRENKYVHDTVVRYVWAREVGHQNERPHYHCAILLNKDAFCTLGHFEIGRDNIFNRLHEAWASALGLPLDAVVGTVHIPHNPCYYLRGDNQTSIEEFFYRASYLCKNATKTSGHGGHGFGASRL